MNVDEAIGIVGNAYKTDPIRLYAMDPWIAWNPDHRFPDIVYLDGDFTDTLLEAIITIMRAHNEADSSRTSNNESRQPTDAGTAA